MVGSRQPYCGGARKDNLKVPRLRSQFALLPRAPLGMTISSSNQRGSVIFGSRQKLSKYFSERNSTNT